MLHRLCAASVLPAGSRALAAAHRLPYSTQPSTDEIGAGPGSRSRSLKQAQASGETSSTSGPETAPARSPDAPADPADLAANRGSDPEEVLRSSAWQAQQAMSSRWGWVELLRLGALLMSATAAAPAAAADRSSRQS